MFLRGSEIESNTSFRPPKNNNEDYIYREIYNCIRHIDHFLLFIWVLHLQILIRSFSKDEL